MFVQVYVTDEAHRVDDRVRDGHGQHAPGPLEPPAEDQPHHQVAGEPAPALVEVVRTPQYGTGPERPVVGPAELAQPGQQVPDDNDLFEDAVLGGLQDQQRHAVPGARQVDHGDARVDAEFVRGPDQAQPGNADQGGESRSLQGIAAQVQPVQPDAQAAPAGRPVQQYQGQEGRHQPVEN